MWRAPGLAWGPVRMGAHRGARLIVPALFIVLSAAVPITLTHAAGPYSGTAENGFSSPVALPQSTGLGEPTIVHDDGPAMAESRGCMSRAPRASAT